MMDANSAGLLAEINEKHKLTRMWPIALTVGLLALGAGILASQTAVIVAGILISLLAIPIAYWDARRKTTVLFYDLEPPVLPAVEAVHAAFDGLRACVRTWHIEAEGRSADLKYSSGANTTVRRKAVRLMAAAPPYFKTNVAILCLPAGHQRLFFLPDRLLVYDSRGVGAIAYDEVQLTATQTRFVESEGVPGDARVVDRTWRYVNKSGGPDRRFRDNPELPIALYEELFLQSSSGLNEKLQLSRVGASGSFVAAVQQLAGALRQAQVATTNHEVESVITPSRFLDEPTQPRQLIISTEQAKPVTAVRTTTGEGKYFFFTNSVQGPFNREELTEFHRSGSITSETPVCSDDDNRWIPYSQFVEQKQ
jgi:hypothetical protein